MESRDGVAWSEFTQIVSFRGLALPTSGEIAATETFLYFTVTSKFFGFPESVSLFADGSRIIQDSLGHTNIVALDGDFFGTGPDFVNRPCTTTDTISDSGLNFGGSSWRNLAGSLEPGIASGDILISQNGIARNGGEISYGNWKNLGEIKGYHNGVGLVITGPEEAPKLHLSRDFLRTWTLADFSEFNPGGFFDAAFFKNQWLVLAESGITNTAYCLSVEPVTYHAQGKAQLKATLYRDRPFIIPGCKENLTTNLGIELTIPGDANQLYQIYTSTDLKTWTAYDLPFPGATTHNFPIIPDRRSLDKIYFRAEEISIIDQN